MTNTENTQIKEEMTEDEKNFKLNELSTFIDEVVGNGHMANLETAHEDLLQSLSGKPKFWRTAFSTFNKIFIGNKAVCDFGGATLESSIELGHIMPNGEYWVSPFSKVSNAKPLDDSIVSILQNKIEFAKLLDEISESKTTKLSKKQLVSKLLKIADLYHYEVRNGRYKGNRLFNSNKEMMTYTNNALSIRLKYAIKNSSTNCDWSWDKVVGNPLKKVIKVKKAIEVASIGEEEE